MFTWICPQCGREVPPAYNECPDCSGKPAGQPAPPQSVQAQQPPPQQFQPPPQQFQPQRSTMFTAAPPVAPSPQATYAPPPPASGIALPPWLMSIVFAILFLAVGAGAYFTIRHFSGSGQAASAPPLENAPVGSKAKANTLQKYVEVVGVRLIEDAKKKPQVRFVVVNHSGAEISDLAANVNLWARTAKSDDEAIGALAFKLPSLGPYEAKEMIAPLNTKLHIYELPDWQNLAAEVQITSPQ